MVLTFHSTSLLILTIGWTWGISNVNASSYSIHPRATPSQGFYNASASNGGSWLTRAENTGVPPLGEPLNIVISSSSDPFILTLEGYLDFMESLELSGECLGQSGGTPQSANLGDGKGFKNQTGILRYNYGDPYLGTCRETILGGNHIRWWNQNGTKADSGALFMAASMEMNLTYNHNIEGNGYDLGRDALVTMATVIGGTKSPITNRTFSTQSLYEPNFLTANNSLGINHGIATDGMVAVWTVSSTGGPPPTPISGSSSSTSGSTRVSFQNGVNTWCMMLGVLPSVSLGMILLT